ncbi:hypothetical protein [Actinokineospora sp.]|uniref:hypothetical protein n=1 Tax=Actinokineospora sp. TaxID=1872133 RepID=UPI00403767E2
MTTANEGLCEKPDCDRTRAAGPRWRLCAPCVAHVADDLAALPELFAACEEELSQPNPHLRERVSGWRPSGIRLNTGAVEARARIVEVLACWCALVVTERRVTPPAREVGPLAAFLHRHDSWLVAHPAAADYAEEVAGAVRAARRVSRTGATVRTRLGQCPEPGCAAPVSAVSRPDGPGPEVVCADGHALAPHRWLRLSIGAAE